MIRSTQNEESLLEFLRQPGLSLGSVLEDQAKRIADSPAVIFGDAVITYQELNEQANRYAHFFQSNGFQKGQVIALMMENRPDYLYAACGMAKLGIIAALIDITLRGDVLAESINLIEAHAVILGDELRGLYTAISNRLRLHQPATVYVQSAVPDVPDGPALPADVILINPLLELMPHHDPSTNIAVTIDDPLAYMFTAGNHGLRKAAIILHRSWLIIGHRAIQIGDIVKADSRQYMCLSLFLRGGFISSFAAMLLSGGAMVLCRDFSARTFWDDVRKYQVDYVITVAEALRFLLAQPERSDDRNHSLQTIFCNGSSSELSQKFKQRFGTKNIFEVYGVTEGLHTFINFENIPDVFGNLYWSQRRMGEVIRCDLPAEKPVRDEQGWGIRCQPGEVGLMLIAINDLSPFAGYVNNPDAMEDQILRDVFTTGDRYFNTFDLVKLHTGDDVSFVDRLGATYRWKGKTVSTSQVADVIIKFYGAIDDCVVYGVKVKGWEGRCGMAAIRLLEGEKLHLAGLAKHIAARMPLAARPVFLRLLPAEYRPEVSLSELKKQLQEEGYNPSLVSQPMFFWDSDKQEYVPMTPQLFADIQNQLVKI